MNVGNVFRLKVVNLLIFTLVGCTAFVILCLAAWWSGGGPWMVPIGLCGAVSCGLGLERIVALTLVHDIDMQGVVEQVSSTVEKGEINQAWSVVETLPDEPITAVVQGALLTVGKSEKELRRRIEEEVMRHSPRLQSRTHFLSVVANVATLLGLLGTIFGLIACFASISSADPSQKQALLAAGIATAMYTTAGGLMVAIPTLILHAGLSNRQSALLDRFETASVKLFNDLAGVQLSQLRDPNNQSHVA